MVSDCAIILCTKNGDKFLQEQLDSLEAQTHHFDLYINDDGSNDQTYKIIKNFQKRSKYQIHYTRNIYNSAPMNFLKTLKKIERRYDLYFFCDQDDIWEKNKIEISKIRLASLDQKIPSLFCTSTLIINQMSDVIDSSKIFEKEPCFSNALVQSIAGGNTMCFNHQTRNLLDKIINLDSVVSHDWIAYMLVSALGGKVIYSSDSLVKYRKHKKNLIGPNKSIKEMYSRIYQLFQGRMREWTKKNLLILNEFKLPNKSQEILNQFENKAHNGNFFERVNFIVNSNVFRQTYLSNVALHFAIFLKKI